MSTLNGRPLRATGGYDQAITAELLKHGRTDIHPACIEGWMRLQCGTLDHLDPDTFAVEVEIGIACHDDDSEASERNARSYGLVA